MRALLLAAVGALVLGAQAHADAVSTITLSPEARTAFHQKYGEREIATLSEAIRKSIARELAKRGIAESANLRIEVTLVDALPSRPTFQQMSDNVSLDMRSISNGGAELRARLVNGDGQTVSELTERWYESDIRSAFSRATWSDAQYAIRRFARKVAIEYGARV